MIDSGFRGGFAALNPLKAGMTAHWKDYGRETRGQAVNALMTEVGRDISWRQATFRPRSGKHWRFH